MPGLDVGRCLRMCFVLAGVCLTITACSSGGGPATAPVLPSKLGGALKPQVVEQGTGNQFIRFPVGSSMFEPYRPYRIIQSAGKFWFTDNTTSGIGSMTTSGVPTEFPVVGAIGGNSISLAPGPSGAIWFTVHPNHIAYATPAGTVTEISLPAPTNLATAYAPCPFGIAEGSDKAMWFTDQCNSAIGRIDPNTKQVTGEYATPTANSNPEDLIEGPDGNLWIGEYTAGNIARVKPELAGTTGFITELPVGGSPSFLTNAYGSIWFSYSCTSVCRGGVGTITTGANPNVSVFPTDEVNYLSPLAIAPGPDGNIWFSDLGNGSFGSITPAGAYDQNPIASSLFSYGLVTGPDKNVWITDPDNSSIDVAVINPQTVTPTTIAFNMVGETQTFAASENGATLTVTTSNAKVATVAPATTQGSWTVTAVGAGSSTIRVSDQNGNYTPIGVSVTAETFVVR